MNTLVFPWSIRRETDNSDPQEQRRSSRLELLAILDEALQLTDDLSGEDLGTSNATCRPSTNAAGRGYGPHPRQ